MNALERSLMTISCEDCNDLPKVANAGKIIKRGDLDIQVMHNGVNVIAGGYHGDWMAHIIRSLRGHHEPQEELLFHTILRACRHNSVFVELGAFWAYYSLWYLSEIPGSRAICIEPDPFNKSVGEENIRLNGMADRVIYKAGFAGGLSQKQATMHVESQAAPITLPMFDMSSVLELAGSDVVEILHMDIQGAELAFLQSLESTIAQKRLRFVVVSTHHSSISGSTTTHDDCLASIRSMGGRVLCEHNVQESFSGDGLIVASFFKEDEWLTMPKISRNRSQLSLFPEK